MVVGDFAREADLIVIGSGPGGYVAAIRAAQLGRKVIVVERDQMGGTCLNVGCIPSKALISAGHHFAAASTKGLFGVTATKTTIDFTATQKWKNEQVVGRLNKGVAALLQKNGIEVIKGEAHFIDTQTLRIVLDETQGQSYTFKNCIIAVGSRPLELSIAPLGERILDSTGVLALPEIPKRLTIVGGGYIGMELAGAYADLGSAVTVLEAMDRVLAGFETDLVAPVLKHASARGIKIVTGARLTGTKVNDGTVTATYLVGEEEHMVTSDYLGICVGRVPNTDELGLEMTGIHVDERGLIPIDAQCRSAVPAILAIGDVVAGLPLAHKASYEAKVAAAVLSGDKAAALDYAAIPAVCYTTPEVAVTGLTYSEAIAKGFTAKKVKFSLASNGRALSIAEATGFVRLVVDENSLRLLGAQVVGPQASELIGELTLAIENLMTCDDIVATIHAHPTLNESIMDVAEAALGYGIHQ